ncbi:MAG: nucleotidyltransferase family protein [Burkholderiaceae bacterium]
MILAAGPSRRMGQPKQLLHLAGRTLLHRAASTALSSSCRPVIVVVGAHADQLHHELSGLDLLVEENPAWMDGIGTSVRCGIEAVRRHPGADSALLMLCDQPLVTPELIDQLVATHRRTGARIVACEYADTVGVPALFGRGLFEELIALDGDTGARQVIARHADEVVRVPFPAAAFDVDTPEDLARVRAQAQRGRS